MSTSSSLNQQIEVKVAFIVGALDVDISQAMKRQDDSVRLAFPSRVEEGGWFDDALDFPSQEDALRFLEQVETLIRTGRAQRRGE